MKYAIIALALSFSCAAAFADENSGGDVSGGVSCPQCGPTISNPPGLGVTRGVLMQQVPGAAYFCESAGNDPYVPFAMVVTVRDNPNLADITVTFPNSNPTTFQYPAAAYDASDTGTDHVAYVAPGIAVVLYKDPSVLSTALFGDSDSTQAGLTMSCRTH